MGRAFEQLPQLEQALSNGELCWSVVRELTRVATAENEAAWLDWAQGRRAGEVAAAVAERRTGDTPDAKGDPSQVRHRLSFEVRAETMALFRELQTIAHRDLGDRCPPRGGARQHRPAPLPDRFHALSQLRRNEHRRRRQKPSPRARHRGNDRLRRANHWIGGSAPTNQSHTDHPPGNAARGATAPSWSLRGARLPASSISRPPSHRSALGWRHP